MPAFYAIDIYGDDYTMLKTLHDALTTLGQGGKPIYLQETFYNDASTAAGVAKFKALPGVKFGGIFQWPWVRGTQESTGSAILVPKDFDKYIKL